MEYKWSADDPVSKANVTNVSLACSDLSRMLDKRQLT